MTRPLLLDLFCGAGGCSVGYDRAGFDVLGVDHLPHPDYPYAMWEADLSDPAQLVAVILAADPDVIHASPPCPRYSVATSATGTRDSHPDLIPLVLQVLRASGLPWVIENVPGAPLPGATELCAQALGMTGIRRHRLFMVSPILLLGAGCACSNQPTASVYGARGEDRRVPPTSVRANGRPVYKGMTTRQVAGLLEVPWMTDRDDVADAIPPRYAEFVGEQLMAAL